LDGNRTEELYTKAVSAYALSEYIKKTVFAPQNIFTYLILQQKHNPKAQPLLDEYVDNLIEIANVTKPGMLFWWQNEKASKFRAIETSAYVVLAFVNTVSDFNEFFVIISWY